MKQFSLSLLFLSSVFVACGSHESASENRMPKQGAGVRTSESTIVGHWLASCTKSEDMYTITEFEFTSDGSLKIHGRVFADSDCTRSIENQQTTEPHTESPTTKLEIEPLVLAYKVGTVLASGATEIDFQYKGMTEYSVFKLQNDRLYLGEKPGSIPKMRATVLAEEFLTRSKAQ